VRKLIEPVVEILRLPRSPTGCAGGSPIEGARESYSVFGRARA
jgi:hypothetical protein